jgi:Tol biopolymer transport system component
MDGFSSLSRRGLLKAGLGGAGAAAIPLPVGQASTPPFSIPATGPLAGAAGTRALHFTAGTNASVTASPSGDRLIVEVQGVLWSMPRQGGTATALTEPQLEPTRVAWSPDGSLIAVCGYQGGGFHLWTMAPDGSGLRQVTSGPWDDRGVAWSPDGTRLAFASERGGDPAVGSAYRIWTVEVRSGELTQLTSETNDAGVEDYDPVWHPDGSKVLFVRAGAQGGRTLASVPAAGGKLTVERTVEAGTLVGPAISADGRVAYVQLADAIPGAFIVPETTLMVDGEPVTADEDVSPLPPCWTSGGELLYLADGQLRARHPGKTPGKPPAGSVPETIPFTASLPVPRPQYRHKRYDFDATGAREVRGIHLPVLSPDGQSVAFVALNALWVLHIGGRLRKLVQAQPSAYLQMPSWAPDGRSVLYAYDGAAGGGLIGVHRHWLDDGRDEVLASGGRLNPVLSPDGARLACQDSTGNLLVRDLSAAEEKTTDEKTTVGKATAGKAAGEKTLVAPLGANGLPGKPSWSPDGRYIAFCDRNRLNQRFREGYNIIRVVDTRSGKWTAYQPLPHASLSDRGNSGPVWSPDGASMAFIMESALWVLPVTLDGAPLGQPRLLTDEPADHPSWSGDSRSLLYESSGRLRLINADGSGRRTLPVPLSYRRCLPPRSEVIRVHAGRLWDGTTESVRQDVDIVIRGNRITAVEPHRPGAGRAGEQLIDASRSTVIPGLWDSHTHPWQYTYGGRQTSLMLAYGITTNVSLGGFAHEAIRIKESVAADRMTGPRLFTTGELIDGSRVAYSMGRAHRTEDGVRRSLERAVALDYDFVKTYVRASGQLMAQAARTAHQALGVLAGSHLLSPGVNAGQDLTTHLEATQRSEYGRAMSPTGHSYQDVLETYRGGDFKIIITPFSALALLGADPSLAKDPRVTALMPPWDAALIDHLAATPPTPTALDVLATEMASYRRIIAEGGTLALGTDAPLTPIGLHVHLGLRALHRFGGLSAPQALRTATVIPAQLFGVSDDLGTLEAGKLADLTVIDGNPFADFDDLVRISFTMRDGIIHHQDDLMPTDTTHTTHTAHVGHTERHTADRTADRTDWLHIARQLRREPCCSQHKFDI